MLMTTLVNVLELLSCRKKYVNRDIRHTLSATFFKIHTSTKSQYIIDHGYEYDDKLFCCFRSNYSEYYEYFYLHCS